MSKFLTSTSVEPNLVFDRALVARRRSAIKDGHFLLSRAADDAAERLLDIKRDFENALIFGDAQFTDALMQKLTEGKIKQLSRANYSAKPQAGMTLADEEALPFGPQSFDLIISGLSLHQVNNLPGALMQFRAALKPDGLFLGALFGGQTLTELRHILYEVEDALYGGITPRVSPMVDFSQAAALLQGTGFALPVVDTDRITVSYSDITRLFSDLKAMGETNALSARSRAPVSRRFLATASKAYAEAYTGSREKLRATFEILWLTGWAPHPRQQKPLKPGSANMRLADALGVIETKL